MVRDVRHWVVGFTVAMACGASTAPLAQQQQPQPQQPASQGPIKNETRGTTVKLDDLEDKPENYVGKIVTVEGEVDKMLGPHLFTIDERQWADAAREMPVSVPAPFTVALKEDAMVRVTGTVEKIPIDRLEKEIGPITDAKLRARIADRPVLVATAVDEAPGGKSLLTRKGS
jgi:hypothetical protein